MSKFNVDDQVYLVLYTFESGRTKYFVTKGKVTRIIDCTMRKDRFKYYLLTSKGIKKKFESDLYCSKEDAIKQAELLQSICDYKIRRKRDGYSD